MESISVFDIFKIGVGPSSSHTMGPWRAAQQFLAIVRERGEFDRVASVRVDLFGSLAKTGKGHGTDVAVLMGLAGEDPVTCDVGDLPQGRRDPIRAVDRPGGRPRRSPSTPSPTSSSTGPRPCRSTPTASGSPPTDRRSSLAETFYSIGGGFVVREGDPDGGGKQARCRCRSRRRPT